MKHFQLITITMIMTCILLVILTGCNSDGGGVGASCGTNDDCSTGLKCNSFGQCITVECIDITQCPEGMICSDNNNTCIDPLVVDGDTEDEATEDIDGDFIDGDVTEVEVTEDGDTDSSENSETNPLIDGDTEYEAVEDSENETETVEECLPGKYFSCEDLQGDCPEEDQICLTLEDVDEFIKYCFTWEVKNDGDINWYAPLSSPAWDQEHEGYGPKSYKDSRGIDRWLKPCNLEQECDPHTDGFCCKYGQIGYGLWLPEGAIPHNSNTNPHYEYICNADHVVETVLKKGHCAIESDSYVDGDEDGEGESSTFIMNLYPGEVNQNNVCLQCNSEVSQYEWSPRKPVGAICGKYRDGICDEAGECIIPE